MPRAEAHRGREENPANHVYIMNADGSDPARLLADSPGTSAGVTWSPDGRFMLLERKISEQPPERVRTRLRRSDRASPDRRLGGEWSCGFLVRHEV